jgi:LPS O-antigen subunit length determinant protein (WzzB/FepE family)
MPNFFHFLFWIISVVLAATIVAGVGVEFLNPKTVELDVLVQSTVSILLGSLFFLALSKLHLWLSLSRISRVDSNRNSQGRQLVES